MGIVPTASLDKLMKSCRGANGGGRITLVLPESGSENYYAYAYPTRQKAYDTVTADLLRQGRNEVSQEELHTLTEKASTTHIAYGTGKRQEDALNALWAQLATKG